MGEKKLPALTYVGDHVVGVVSECTCPPAPAMADDDAVGGLVATCEHPHESHDIVEPRFADDLPDGVDFEDYQRWCRMFAAAPAMLAALAPAAVEIKESAGDVSHDTWDPEAHVEITLTIAECRAIRAAIAAARGG